MLQRFREQLGAAGLVVAFVALAVAIAGGAYAASSPGGGKATASAKGKKGPTGPRGKTGKTGPAGAPGAKGDTGATGANGANGKDGAPGVEGKAGNGVALTPIPTGTAKCHEDGGTKVEVQGGGSSADVCNGKEGEKGDTGDKGDKGEPWTPNGTLPVGATETGVWAFNATEADTNVMAPISFTIPLAGELSAGQVHFSTEADFEEKCFPKGAGSEEGGVTNPIALSGNLCVYLPFFGGLSEASFGSITKLLFGEQGASKSGALLRFTVTGPAAFGSGAWAVTG